MIGQLLLGPSQGTTLPNPHPSSPLFSSVLALHFSAGVEKATAGVTLTAADPACTASPTPTAT